MKYKLFNLQSNLKNKTKQMKKNFTYFSLCSGMEAATVAWEPLGWECGGLCEFARFPQSVLKHHYPNVPLFENMLTLLQDEKFKKIKTNLIVGGTPCQDFSDAGLNKGMDGLRAQLAIEYGKILEEKRPQWFIWENVEGIFKKQHRKGLCDIISSFTGIEFKPEELDKQGIIQGEKYSIAYRVLDSQYFGVPQRRKRIYIVGYRGKDWRPPFAVLFEQGCFGEIKNKNQKKRNVNPQNIRGEIKLAGTITKSFAKVSTDGFGKNSTSNYWVDEKGIRYLTEKELLRLQGFPDDYLDFKIRGKKINYSAVKGVVGNSMTVNVMRWIGNRINMVEKVLKKKYG